MKKCQEFEKTPMKDLIKNVLKVFKLITRILLGGYYPIS